MSIADGAYWAEQQRREEEAKKRRIDMESLSRKALKNSLCKFCKNAEFCKHKENCESLHIELYKRTIELNQPFTVTVKCKFYNQIEIEPPITNKDVEEFERSIGVEDYSEDIACKPKRLVYVSTGNSKKLNSKLEKNCFPKEATESRNCNIVD